MRYPKALDTRLPVGLLDFLAGVDQLARAVHPEIGRLFGVVREATFERARLGVEGVAKNAFTDAVHAVDGVVGVGAEQEEGITGHGGRFGNRNTQTDGSSTGGGVN